MLNFTATIMLRIDVNVVTLGVSHWGFVHLFNAFFERRFTGLHKTSNYLLLVWLVKQHPLYTTCDGTRLYLPPRSFSLSSPK